MKVSRRKLAATIATAAAAAALPQPADPQQPPSAPADPELAAARASLESSLRTVRALALPIAVEPAARFETKG